MMDEIFKKEIKGKLIIVYMDNVLGLSKTINGLKKIKWIVLGTRKSMRTWLVLQNQEMQIQETKDQISWACGMRKKTGNGLS